MLPNTPRSIVRFGSFELDREARELRRDGLPIRLRDQPIRVLLALLDGEGRVVTREELRHRLWPTGVFVEFDRAINKAVWELRRALDRPGERSLVETVSKRGYRFAAGRNDGTHSDAGGPHAVTTLPTDAIAAYLTGRYLCSRRRVSDLLAGIACFERSLALDRDDAAAHAGLASAHVVLGIWGVHPPDRAFGAARRSAIRALEADSGLADAQNAFADVLKGHDWSWDESERHYRRALSIDPACAGAHQGYAQLLVALGRHGEAVHHIELARRADPISAAITSYGPYVYLAARQYRRALHEAKRAVAREPYSPLAYWVLGRAFLFSGRGQDAVATLEQASELAGHGSMWVSELCYARGAAGDRTGANALFRVLNERSRREYISPFDLAIACLGVGDRCGALDHLEDAFAHRVMRLTGLGDPEFDRLGTTRRSLLQRLGLPGAR